MKNIKFLLGAVVAIMPAALMAQTANYTLNGKVGQLSAPAKAYLMYSNAAGRQTDSAAINNGAFTFTGTIDQPKIANLVVNKKGTGVQSDDASYIELYLEAGNILVTSPDSIDNAKVKAGGVNADNNKLNLLLAPTNVKMAQIDKDYQAASEEQKKSKEFGDNLQKRSSAIEAEQKVIYSDFIKANPNSLISFMAVKNYGGAVQDVNEVEPLFNSLSSDIRSSAAGIEYAADIAAMKKTAVGMLAPDFTQSDTTGKAVSLHDFKGKYVLIDFWASWCGPCRAENPNVVKAYTKYQSKGFTILGVSLDAAASRAAWVKAINDDDLTWTEVSDLKGWKNSAAQLYFVHAIPQNFLVGPDGKIVAKDLRGDVLDKKLEELLK